MKPEISILGVLSYRQFGWIALTEAGRWEYCIVDAGRTRFFNCKMPTGSLIMWAINQFNKETTNQVIIFCALYQSNLKRLMIIKTIVKPFYPEKESKLDGDSRKLVVRSGYRFSLVSLRSNIYIQNYIKTNWNVNQIFRIFNFRKTIQLSFFLFCCFDLSNPIKI